MFSGKVLIRFSEEEQRSDTALLTGVVRHSRTMNVSEKVSANSFVVHDDFASVNSMHGKQKTLTSATGHPRLFLEPLVAK